MRAHSGHSYLNSTSWWVLTDQTGMASMTCPIINSMWCHAQRKSFWDTFSITFHLMPEIFSVLLITLQSTMACLNMIGNHLVSIRRATFQLNRNTSHIHQNYHCFKWRKMTSMPKTSKNKLWDMKCTANYKLHQVYLDSDSFLIGVDNHCLATMSPNKDHFKDLKLR